MLSEEKQKRLENRIDEILKSKTPVELSFVIWTKTLENATHSLECYREPFVNWIECHKNKTKSQWSYKTPAELANAIWKPKLELDKEDNIWFSTLRENLVAWINSYCA